MNNWKTILDLKLSIYFELTRTQQRKLYSLGYSNVFLDETPMELFKKVTKSKKLIEKLILLKRLNLRSVA